MARTDAHLNHEKTLVTLGEFIIGVDEVGRGALAGPVCVGAVLLNPHSSTDVPAGLTDSKLVSAARRAQLVPQIYAWCTSAAVGFASAAEIDAVGIIAALRRAAERAIREVMLALPNQPPPLVLLDGHHDWLTRPEAMLTLPYEAARPDPCADHDVVVPSVGEVVTKTKADVSCASVAAASVLAKQTRDAHLGALAEQYPEYGWRSNKGYAAQEHRDALAEHGVTPEHRWSWNLFAGSQA